MPAWRVLRSTSAARYDVAAARTPNDLRVLLEAQEAVHA